MKNNYKKLIKSTAILSLGTFCTKVLTFILIPFYTRWLTQEDYGIYDLIVTYISLVLPVLTLDLGEAVFRFLLDNIKDESKIKKIISNSLSVVILIFIAVSFVGIPILSNFVNGKLAILIVLLLFVEIINNFFMMIMRGIKKLNFYAISSILFIIITFICNFILLKQLHLGLNGIIIGYIAGYACSSIFMFFTAKLYKYIKIRPLDFKIIKSLIFYSTPLIPNAVSWWILDASDRTIVATYLGVSSSAILAVAHKIPNICHTFYNVFHLSWQENASETIDLQENERNQYYNGVFNNMLSILISVQAVILSSIFIFFKYVMNPDYFLGYYQAPILVASLTFSMIAQFIGGIYIATKETKKNGFTTIISAILNIIFHLLLIKYIGLYASTISTLLSYFILFLLRYIDIRKKIKLKLSVDNIKNIVIMLYFFVCIYFNSAILNIINLILAIIFFFIVNKSKMFGIIKMLKVKIKKVRNS